MRFLVFLAVLLVKLGPLDLVDAFLQRGVAKWTGLFLVLMFGQLRQTLRSVAPIPDGEDVLAPLALDWRMHALEVFPRPIVSLEKRR